MDSCSSDRAKQQCALCWNKARIGNTCDACRDSMGLDPSDRAGPVAVFVQPKLPRVKFHANKPGESYMPCNGTEGEFFHSMWCEECARDKAMNGTVYREGREETDEDWCEILGRSFREDAIPEWVYGADGQPCCTQFVPMEQEITARCEHTADMFGPAPTASGSIHNAGPDEHE